MSERGHTLIVLELGRRSIVSKRTQASGDGVLASRFDLDVVRRIGIAEMDHITVEQTIEVGRRR